MTLRGCTMRTNPCQQCGACCACYKVCFPFNESDDNAGGTVPNEQTVILDASQRAMRGTERFHKRCVALQGVIGIQVSCKIYANRPSTCRNFIPSWQGDFSNAHCDRARATYGLVAFGDY